uniref:Uncharacterized protein n=1 Tax=Arundo donax TaxID=35708 RepID=A0A0A8YM38_ARUDO
MQSDEPFQSGSFGTGILRGSYVSRLN